MYILYLWKTVRVLFRNIRFYCMLLVCGKIRPRIIGGKPETRYWPWLGGLIRNRGSGDSIICGATLLAKNFVITASHCFQEDPSTTNTTYKIALNFLRREDVNNLSSGVKIVEIKNIIHHSNYSQVPIYNIL